MKPALFFFCLLPLFSFAQKLDTAYRDTYWEQRVSLFRQLPDTKGEIIFLGNSITDGGEWAEMWQDSRVKNRGISADITFGVLARLDEVVSSHPVKVFILIGVNDIARNIPDSVIIDNHRKIVSTIRTVSPNTKIYCQSILPTNNEFTRFSRHYNKDEHIRAVNKALADLCNATPNCTYVDLYTRFLNAEGKLDKAYTNDGLHLTGAGYLLWKRILQENGYMK